MFASDSSTIRKPPWHSSRHMDFQILWVVHRQNWRTTCLLFGNEQLFCWTVRNPRKVRLKRFNLQEGGECSRAQEEISCVRSFVFCRGSVSAIFSAAVHLLNYQPRCRYKDLDWMRSGHRWEFKGSREQAMETLKQDVRFLAQQGIIDYSLLVGVHKRAAQTDPSWHEPAPHPIRSLVLRQVTEKTIIYFGIVDILTPYSTRKKLEK